MKYFPESEYRIPFFDEYGYIRKQCPVCTEYFWTQNPDKITCGEATSKGCAPLTFINNPPTQKPYDYGEMRETFLSFFEKRGHERIKPYPVVSRWRDDLYFTSASIVNFQPHVTNGVIPPPANPLVISQPCVRFVDVDNVGPTFGRHLTIFEMGGHHVFNYLDQEVYWKDQTVRFHHEFITNELGIASEEVIYKEGFWSGGGNAGPDVESIVRGLEVATLVFMKFKVVRGELVDLPIRTVDTGYGIERLIWLSQGTLSCFHATYDSILNKILKMAGISRIDDELLTKVSILSGMMILEKTSSRAKARRMIGERVGIEWEELKKVLVPIESAFAVSDHSKCLAFTLAEGIVPSNMREGYLARLMIRRTYRLLRTLEIEEKLFDIIDLQIAYWSKDYPYLKDTRDEILEILSVEKNKFMETLKRGSLLVQRQVQLLKAKGVSQFPIETLVELYDSQGLPPEVVQETANKEGVQTEVPEDFYTMVAKRHVQAPLTREVKPLEEIESMILDNPETRRLYYEDPYLTKFKARVIRVLKGNYLIFEKTGFYPEGGGQPADRGYVKSDKTMSRVVDVQRIGKIIVHVLNGSVPKEGDEVSCSVDWDRRIRLMRQHSATHILMGAARRVLGEHVWQAGAQKGVERSRLDISHFKRLTLEEIHEIERLANQEVMKNTPIEISWMPREDAERLYGFRLYQGGVVPGREIRVVRTRDWEVEACGGIHCKATGEIGFIKIFNTERVQDGVERIIFGAGPSALKTVQENETVLWKVSKRFGVPFEKIENSLERIFAEWKQARRNRKLLLKEIAIKDSSRLLDQVEVLEAGPTGEVNYLVQRFEPMDVDRMIKTASKVVKKDSKAVVLFHGKNLNIARVVVMAGKDAVKLGINANEIAEKAASVLGGGGSGRCDFAQGGGNRIRKMAEALLEAKKTTRKQLEEKIPVS